jgi:hypothetical protein
MPSKFVSRPQRFCACIIVTVFPEQTVARLGNLVFCVCKSSAGSREHELAHTVGEKRRLYQLCWWRGRRKPQQYEPLERNERVCGEEPDTGTHPNVKSGFNLCLSSSNGFDQLSRHLIK